MTEDFDSIRALLRRHHRAGDETDLVRLREVLAGLPPDAASFARGYVAFQAGEDAAAAGFLGRAARAYCESHAEPPGPDELFYDWIDCFMLAGDDAPGPELWDVMADAFSARWPEWAGVQTLRGLARRYDPDDEAAVQELSAALARDPAFWPARLVRAGSNWRLENWADALADGREVFTHRRPAGDAELLLEVAGWHEERRDYRGAADLYRQAIVMEPDKADTYLRQGLCLERLGADDEAVAAFAAAASKDSEIEIEACQHRIRVLMGTGHDREAWELLEHVAAAGLEDAKWAWPQRVAAARRLGIDPGPRPVAATTEPGVERHRRERVQAVVANVSAPGDLRQFEERVLDNYNSTGIDGITDVDAVLRFEEIASGTSWTGARWMLPGDLLFFHCTKRGTAFLRRIAAEVDPGTITRTRAAVQRSRELFELYGGTIFAYAIVAGEAERHEGNAAAHFDSRIFLPLESVFVFDRPAAARDLRSAFQINTGPIGAYLNATGFAELKRQLMALNADVGPLAHLEFGDLRLDRARSSGDWHAILRSPDIRFLYEEQVSEYFVEPLLEAIKDPRTTVHKECVCEPIDTDLQAGRVDYFVRVEGQWVPVEVKLSTRLEIDLLAQVKKYNHLRAFVPSRGPTAGCRQEVHDSTVCVVIDAAGIYIAADGQIGAPGWRREDLSTATPRAVRERLIALLSSG